MGNSFNIFEEIIGIFIKIYEKSQLTTRITYSQTEIHKFNIFIAGSTNK